MRIYEFKLIMKRIMILFACIMMIISACTQPMIKSYGTAADSIRSVSLNTKELMIKSKSRIQHIEYSKMNAIMLFSSGLKDSIKCDIYSDGNNLCINTPDQINYIDGLLLRGDYLVLVSGLKLVAVYNIDKNELVLFDSSILIEDAYLMDNEFHVNYHAPLNKIAYIDESVGYCTYYVMLVINKTGVQESNFFIDNYDGNSPTLQEFRSNPKKYYKILKLSLYNKYK